MTGPTATRLTLVCQGATAATRAAAFASAADELEPRARAALPELRARLGWRDRARAAPSRAALDTAAALAAEAVPDHALRDCDFGSWSGRPTVAVGADDPEGFARWLSDPDAAPHGGEPLSAVLTRLRIWLAGCAAVPTTYLAVVPPLVVRALVVVALDLPAPVFWRLDAAPLAVSRLIARDGRWRLAGFNAKP